MNFDEISLYYKTNPPRVTFGSPEAQKIRMRVTSKFPYDDATKDLGPIVYKTRTTVAPNTPPTSRYCFVDVCLDFTGTSAPDIISLPNEMKDNEVQITLYLDELDCIRLRAIGGYNPYV